MIVMDFLERMQATGIFSLADIALLYPDLDRRRLFEWQQKGYIIKLRNEWYCLPGFLENPFSTWIIANVIHSPSYISLESALDHYGVIPEGVYMTTSVTSNRPIRIDAGGQQYLYSSVKSTLYKGYLLEDTGMHNRKVRIADLEKALVDFFYFRTKYATIRSIVTLRFNEPVLRDQLNTDRLMGYVDEAKNASLESRIRKMLKVYIHA